eukprot:6243345-Alexandrium_andersonii.AAC.1
MSASLVGSEMCIRDSACPRWDAALPLLAYLPSRSITASLLTYLRTCLHLCLLYTSDAADDM